MLTSRGVTMLAPRGNTPGPRAEAYCDAAAAERPAAGTAAACFGDACCATSSMALQRMEGMFGRQRSAAFRSSFAVSWTHRQPARHLQIPSLSPIIL